VPCRDRCGVFAGEDAADGLKVDGAVGGDSECRDKLGFGSVLGRIAAVTDPDLQRKPDTMAALSRPATVTIRNRSSRKRVTLSPNISRQ